MKISPLVLVSLVICLLTPLAVCQCFGADCRLNLPSIDTQKMTQQERIKFVDTEIQRSYWYYLRDSSKLFQVNVNVSSTETMFFTIYRNVVGTFLTVAVLKNSRINITTFVKLGAGSSPDSNTSLNLQPLIISLQLSSTEVLLQVKENGDLFLNGRNIVNQQEILERNTKIIDAEIRKQYYFYLANSILTHTDHIQTTERDYHALTYSGITGSYFALASIQGETVRINTLVLLGEEEKNNEVDLSPKLIAFC